VDPSHLILGRATNDPYLRLSARIADLEEGLRRLSLQSALGTTQGQPTGGASGLAVDTVQPRLWVPRNGGWQYATLT
jgi:hypothetical protein